MKAGIRAANLMVLAVACSGSLVAADDRPYAVEDTEPCVFFDSPDVVDITEGETLRFNLFRVGGTSERLVFTYGTWTTDSGFAATWRAANAISKPIIEWAIGSAGKQEFPVTAQTKIVQGGKTIALDDENGMRTIDFPSYAKLGEYLLDSARVVGPQSVRVRIFDPGEKPAAQAAGTPDVITVTASDGTVLSDRLLHRVSVEADSTFRLTFKRTGTGTGAVKLEIVQLASPVISGGKHWSMPESVTWANGDLGDKTVSLACPSSAIGEGAVLAFSTWSTKAAANFGENGHGEMPHAILNAVKFTVTEKSVEREYDNDGNPLPIISCAAAQTVDEGCGTAKIALKLDQPYAKDAKVSFAVQVSTTAAEGADFTVLTPSPLVIPAGSTEAEIRVKINEDEIYEAGDKIDLLITAVSNCTVSRLHTIDIADNDPDVEPSIHIEGPADVDLVEGESVTYTFTRRGRSEDRIVGFSGVCINETGFSSTAEAVAAINKSGTVDWPVGVGGTVTYTLTAVDRGQSGLRTMDRPFKMTTLPGEKAVAISGTASVHIRIHDQGWTPDDGESSGDPDSDSPVPDEPVVEDPVVTNAVEWESFPSGGHDEFVNAGDVTAKLEDLGIPLAEKYPNSGKGANGLCYYPRNVWALKAYGGRLYVGSGNSSNGGPYANAFNAAVFCFDPATTNFINEGDIMECQLDVFRVFSDGKLYIPSHDPSYGNPSNPLCGYYLRTSGASGTWTRASKFNNDVHNYDMAEFDGCLFACGYNMWWSSDGGESYTIRGGGGERTTALFQFTNVLYGVGIAQGEREKWAYIYNAETGKSEYGSYTAKPDVTLFVRKAGDTTITCKYLSEQNELIFPGVSDFGVSGFKATRPVSYKNRVVYIGGRVHNDHQIAPVAAFVAVPPRNVPDDEFHPFKASRIDLPEGAKPWSTMVLDDKVYILWSTKDGEKTVNHLSASTNALYFSEILSFQANTFARSVEYLDGFLYFGLGTEISDDGYFEGQTLVIEYSASELCADSGRILRVKFDPATMSVDGEVIPEEGDPSDDDPTGDDPIGDGPVTDDPVVATCTWKGGSTGRAQKWEWAGNWVEGQVPTREDDVVIPASVGHLPIIADERTVGSLVAFTNLTVNAGGSLTASDSLTLKAGAMLTLYTPLVIGGDLTLEPGSVLTHKKPADNDKVWRVCDVTVGGDVEICAGAKVDVLGRGYYGNWGESYTNKAAGVHGGVGGVCDNLIASKDYVAGTCYDGVFWPTNYGGSGPGSANSSTCAGGAFVLRATGTVTHNGAILADAADPGKTGRWTGAGGSVSIRAGRLVGNGGISANGMNSNYSPFTAGGGGRISLVLTEPGADFSQFSGAVTAYGGTQVNTTKRCGGAGTIYRQTGDEKDGEGTIYLSNGGVGVTMLEYNYDMTGLGYPGMDDLSKATVVLGPNSGLYLYSDCTVGKLRFEGTTADEPASINFNSHTLTVNEPKPTASEWTDPDKYKFANVYNGTIAYEGASNLQWKWKKKGLVICIQ